MTTEDLINTIISDHDLSSKGWIHFKELRNGTGHKSGGEGFIDLYSFNLYPSSGYKRRAYEMKLTYNDFCHEMRHPQKRRAAILYSNEYYFVAPVGILPKHKIPIECGLIEITEIKGRFVQNKTIKAPHYDGAPNWGFLASICRRVKEMEQKNE